jgi:hypothetical protein
MICNDKRGNLRNIERFELLLCCHSSSAGRRFNPYQAHQNQPRTSPPPSSQSPCRRSVGSRTQKMFSPSLSCRASNLTGCGKTMLVSLVRLVLLVCLVSLVHLVGLVQANNRDRQDRPNRPDGLAPLAARVSIWFILSVSSLLFIAPDKPNRPDQPNQINQIDQPNQTDRPRRECESWTFRGIPRRFSRRGRHSS